MKMGLKNMTRLEIEQIPIFEDNYAYLIHDPSSGATAAIDPAMAEPVLQRLHEKSWRLSHIFVTHHHDDHVGGNMTLKAKTSCKIVGNAADAARIPGIDVEAQPGQSCMMGNAAIMIMDACGHTSGHVVFWVPDAHALFSGDALFALGCGRLFEGSAEQMWDALSRMRSLPDDTMVYCGHEYTKSNARFAKTIEQGNKALDERIAWIETTSAAPGVFVPFSLALEKATSPFLRADVAAVKKAVGMAEDANPAKVFAEIRRRKDTF